MWSHPATQANVALLRERGAVIAEPGDRRRGTARVEGRGGKGRLAEPADLLALVERTLAGGDSGRAEALLGATSDADARASALLGPSGDLNGRGVVVSAGGTREAIDAVRFIGTARRAGWASPWPKPPRRAART